MLKGKTALAYTAGVIDGEGSISIIDKQVGVKVGNTKEWLCQWLKMQYGGYIWHQNAKGNQVEFWVWTITTRKAASFLKLILPYLQLKRPQAELAIMFQATQKHGGSKGSRYSDEERAVKEAQRILMHQYNKRGRLEALVKPTAKP